MAFLCSLSAYADQVKESRNDCSENENNKKTVVNAKEMRAHLTACQYPKMPGAWCGQGTIYVLVHIDKTGQVQCASALSTKTWPNIKLIAEQTAMRWKFTPFEQNTEKIEVKGIIPMNISWNRKPTKTCGL